MTIAASDAAAPVALLNRKEPSHSDTSANMATSRPFPPATQDANKPALIPQLMTNSVKKGTMTPAQLKQRVGMRNPRKGTRSASSEATDGGIMAGR
mmetsp:Transcript_106/g.252  ORF Transcript_106/g.252 Transcript_106/m.252 type:complete len:96 (+) Transcript_106:2721-3008(+)